MKRRELNRSSILDLAGRRDAVRRRRLFSVAHQSVDPPPGVWPLVILMQLLTLPALAEVGSFSPARFKEGSASLAAAIVFPRDDPAATIDVTLNCDAYVSSRGSFLENYCFVPRDSLDEYVRAVAIGVSNVRLEPAMVDGEAKRVWFQYSVTFQRGTSGETIAVFPHHGGVEYSQGGSFSSPQRYGRPPTGFGRFCAYHRAVLLQIHVAPTGDPEKIEFLGEATRSCARSLKAFVDGSRYIPAMRNGVPIASSYQEVFWVF